MEAQNINAQQPTEVPEVAPAAPASVWARIAALPVVADATSKVASLYMSAKNYNENVTCAFTRVEEAVLAAYNYVAGTEFVNAKVLPQVHTVVEPFVSEQLDKLEQAYPIVKAPTDEVISSAKESAKPAVDFVYAKVEAVRSYAENASAGAA